MVSTDSLRAIERRLGPGFEVRAFKVDPAGRRMAATVVVRADYAPFRGHFPGRPILPAVAQLALVTDLAAVALEVETLRVTLIRRARFLSVVEPGTPFRVEADLSRPSSIEAVLTRDGATVAEMHLTFQEGS